MKVWGTAGTALFVGALLALGGMYLIARRWHPESEE